MVRSRQGVEVDPAQKKPGRGAYVHPDRGCVERAVTRGGLARTLRCAVPARVTDELKLLSAELEGGTR